MGARSDAKCTALGLKMHSCVARNDFENACIATLRSMRHQNAPPWGRILATNAPHSGGKTLLIHCVNRSRRNPAAFIFEACPGRRNLAAFKFWGYPGRATPADAKSTRKTLRFGTQIWGRPRSQKSRSIKVEGSAGGKTLLILWVNRSRRNPAAFIFGAYPGRRNPAAFKFWGYPGRKNPAILK